MIHTRLPAETASKIPMDLTSPHDPVLCGNVTVFEFVIAPADGADQMPDADTPRL